MRREPELEARLHAALEARGPAYVPRTIHTSPTGAPLFSNRLLFEQSPYLLQHAHNPVDWRPWGDEAFAAARERGVPVFLSIGYATCHWCHVMEEESFEDLEIAGLMNDRFVPVKIDREQRPDVDSVYMTAVQMLTGSGGWPMTVCLTPDREPFFAGTYFPPRDGARGSRRGLLTILRELSSAYTADTARVLTYAKDFSQRMRDAAASAPAGSVPDATALDGALTQLQRGFDTTYGGFGHGQKFPRPAALDLALRLHRRTGDQAAFVMAVMTLEKMAAGGIHDQLGGGFHRYTVDRAWLVPHFEKMLYDNAQLADLYLSAWQVTGHTSFALVTRSTLDYLLRERSSPEGAFRSATDADSANPSGEREEGWFFTWTPAELAALLDPVTARIVAEVWGVTPAGNFEGRNILHLNAPVEDAARTLGLPVREVLDALRRARPVLYDARALRPRPLSDDKVLASWNGLTISALARAGAALPEPRYLQAAVQAADVICTTMRKGKHLARVLLDGVASGTGVLDDYAFVAAGFIDLFEATGDGRWLGEALSLVETMNAEFSDPNGGYFLTGTQSEALLVREKPDYDGSEPSGNSVAALVLLRLAEITENVAFREAAERTLGSLRRILTESPTAVPKLACALDFVHDRPKQIAVVVPPGDEARAMREVLGRRYLPNAVQVTTSDPEGLTGLIPWLTGKVAVDGKPTAYVCEGHVCAAPTTNPAEFAAQLDPMPVR